jgi:hypothetical protein
MNYFDIELEMEVVAAMTTKTVCSLMASVWDVCAGNRCSCEVRPTKLFAAAATSSNQFVNSMAFDYILDKIIDMLIRFL